MMQKYQTLRLNVLLHLIATSSWVTYLIKRQKKGLVDKSAIFLFIENSDLDRARATLVTKA